MKFKEDFRGAHRSVCKCAEIMTVGTHSIGSFKTLYYQPICRNSAKTSLIKKSDQFIDQEIQKNISPIFLWEFLSKLVVETKRINLF